MILIVGTRLAVRKRDHDVAAYVLNPEGSVVQGKLRIDESTDHTDRMEVSIKYVHLASLEVSCVKPWTQRGCRQRQSLIDCVAGTVHFPDCVCRVCGGIPARNRAVLCGEQEKRRQAGSHFKGASVVEYGSCRGSARLSVGRWNRNHQRLRHT